MESRGVNQSDLARYTGVSQQSISFYLSGKVEPKDIEILFKLKRFFRVSMFELTGLESMKGIEEKLAAARSGELEMPDDAKEMIELYRKIDDPNVKALIQDMIIKAAERAVKKEEPDTGPNREKP